jgi:lipoprotein-releasing system ATP-binding protein
LQGRTPVSIRTIDLSKRYQSGDSELVIFHKLNLRVEAGERVALIGESGAGKSTLLHLLGGLDRPTEGRILFGERDITELDEPRMADFRGQEIGFVWQTYYLLPEFTALENVCMPLMIRGMRRAVAERPAKAMLEEVGLSARLHHRSGELSGGEQQRVAIARALVTRPGVLLADEPTGNLDYKTGGMVAELFDQLHRRHSLTSVVVTHNIEFARRCDRIIKLEKGSLDQIEVGEPKALFAGLQREDVAGLTARQEGGTEHV